MQWQSMAFDTDLFCKVNTYSMTVHNSPLNPHVDINN